MRTRLRRLLFGRDDGAMLIIAILVVTVVALVTGAVLTRGDGSLRAAVALRDAARVSYAADSAAQVAINALRVGDNIGNAEPTPWYFTNATGTGCFGYDAGGVIKDTLTLNNLIPKGANDTQSAMSAAVVCTPEDATGEQGSAVPINNANKPGNAILTLGTSNAERGFYFKANGNGAAFRVRGGVWSNSDILGDNGNLESTESIRAVSGCSPVNAMVAPVVNCAASTVNDPNYQSDIDIAGTGIPALQTPPGSCPNNGSITLDPGYYDDVTALNNLTNTNQNCFLHFTPGAYYFDFHNNSADSLYDNDIAPNAGDTWVIGGRKTIVAGTLTSDTTVPGRCVNPITDVNAQGVQFVFGGDSRMAIDANGQNTAVEICASYRSTRPPIAIYGQKTGVATATNVAGGAALTTSGTPTVTPAGGAIGTYTGATAANLQAADGVVATEANLAVWARDGNGANSVQTRAITMTGFAPNTNLPKGTVLTGARLQVTHMSNGSQNTINLTPNLGTGPINVNLPVRGTLGLEDLNLSAQGGWGAFQKAVHDNGFSGATVAFSGNLGRNQTSRLDAVRLELTYYLPQLRGQTTAAISSNTVATVGGSPVVQASGNATTLYIQGTTYTPLASLDLALNNIASSVFRFGVIARALKVFETGSFSYPGAVIELPDNSPGFGIDNTLLRLKVYVCPGVSGCTANNGTLALTTRVKLDDHGLAPGPPNRRIDILNWSHNR